ncbi:MAG: NAD(P)H-dependent glycerol-3-phosphate dehydrogenase [Gammaproteobacteria bacterium]|nr:NAD(P)H-dependent glycerol-3-phosphate dehydrogenase [Gammaproteobacteria bacterium]
MPVAGVSRIEVCVLGAGSWGTALAMLLARNGVAVVLWGRDRAHVERMAAERCNRRYLPGRSFPDALALEHDLEAALARARLVLVVVPSEGFRETLERVRASAAGLEGIAWATKGFEPGSGRLLHRVVGEVLGAQLPSAVLSGPTFAGEVADGLPTALTCASENAAFAEGVAELFHNDRFRPYTSTDLVGVQLGGAVKNVFAIAAGISDGLGFGANSRAALITRGLAEMVRLGGALGGEPRTFMGLAGLGDLVLTCTDDQSRNRRFGLALAAGCSVREAAARVEQVVEGIGAARETMREAMRMRVEMPIAAQVERVLEGEVAPAAAVHELLARPPGTELD